MYTGVGAGWGATLLVGKTGMDPKWEEIKVRAGGL